VNTLPAPRLKSESRSKRDKKVEGTSRRSTDFRFRILKRGGWKAGFRLEEVFWDVLEDAARSENMRLAEYIRVALEKNGGDATNNSSMLRVQAIGYLLALRRETKGQLQDLLNAALAAPTPCFVLNSDRKLIGHNREFHALVYSTAERAAGGATSAHLALNVPIGKLIQVLDEQPAKAIVCDYAIRLDANAGRLKGKAKVSLIRIDGAPLLVGYIVEVGR